MPPLPGAYVEEPSPCAESKVLDNRPSDWFSTPELHSSEFPSQLSQPRHFQRLDKVLLHTL